MIALATIDHVVIVFFDLLGRYFQLGLCPFAARSNSLSIIYIFQLFHQPLTQINTLLLLPLCYILQIASSFAHFFLHIYFLGTSCFKGVTRYLLGQPLPNLGGLCFTPIYWHPRIVFLHFTALPCLSLGNKTSNIFYQKRYSLH